MGSDVYRPLTEDMRWSYSRITSFEQCPYGWFLKYIHGSSEEELFYASFGSFMHKLLEKFYKGKASPAELEAEFFINFNDNVHGDRPKNIDQYIEQGSAFLRNLKPIPYHILGVEKRVLFEIGGKHFIGFIDLLAKNDEGIIIIDHKSHKLKPWSKKSKSGVLSKSDEELLQYLRQLYLYSAAVEQEYGETPTKLCFNCFLNGQFVEEQFDKARYEDVKKWAVKEIEIVEKADDFYPKFDWFFCKNLCGQHDDCCYYDDWRRKAP